MGLDDLGLELDFPALLVSCYWVERHCVIPDGFRRGDPFDLVGWQAHSLLNFYRLRPDARLGQLATAFHFRRSQLVGPQKCGKAPYTAAHVCLEGVGPALFAGWASGGERWDCREHGCGCGWVYEYQPGEGMGQAWPTSLIQITAFSEKQTDNIYSALRPMIQDGPLADLVPRTGEEMIRLPNGGRIDVVTSEARSRLGARVTFCPQDETGIWTESAKMVEVAKTQRRGLAGMGGRSEETTNAWDPNQNSVAQQTADAAGKRADIFRWHPQAPKGLSYRNKAERRRIHDVVYEGCPWIDLDGIEGEAAELILTDPGNAERFFGNRAVAGAGVAFDLDLVKSRKRAGFLPPRGSIITVGVDGALLDDALALVATDVLTGFTWPLIIIERPENASEDYQHDKDAADGAMIEAMEMFTVWRVYIDDQYIDTLVEKWKNRYGDKRILVWRTNRPRNMAWAVRELTEAIGDGSWSYSGDETLTTHFGQAQKAPVNILDDKERPMYILSKDSTDSPRKKDGADGAVLSWKARSDAVELGIVQIEPGPGVPVEPVPARGGWRPGEDVPAADLWRQPVSSEGNPFGFMG